MLWSPRWAQRVSREKPLGSRATATGLEQRVRRHAQGVGDLGDEVDAGTAVASQDVVQVRTRNTGSLGNFSDAQLLVVDLDAKITNEGLAKTRYFLDTDFRHGLGCANDEPQENASSNS